MRHRAILSVSAAVLIAACSGGGTASTPTATTAAAPSGAPTPSAAKASAAASPSADIVVGGDRPVSVHVPPGYDPAKPAPLLLVLHGFGSSGTEHDAYFHLGDEAASRGYLYAYPDGTLDSNGNHFWNATEACCDFDGTKVDDVAYLQGVIDEIKSKLAVDPKRVDVIGHSNGGFMAYALSCAHPGTIAAMVSLAGATFSKSSDCAPTDPVAVLQIHGTADDTVAFEGGSLDLGPGQQAGAYPGAEASVAAWAKSDGCTGSNVVDEHVDVDVDGSLNGSPAEATVTRWSGCQPGGAVELWTMKGGGHAPDISDAFPAAVLDFFEAHPKP